MNDILSRQTVSALVPGMITVLVYEFASAGGSADLALPPAILAEGRAMRDAACADLARLPGIAVVAGACDSADQPAAGRPLTPRSEECTEDRLRRGANAADAVWLIAPESDGIALALARVLEKTVCNTLGCRSDAIELACSKSRTLARFAAAGLATAATWPLAQAPLQLHDSWVLKPDVGCGCERMHRVSRTQAEAIRGGMMPSDIDAMIAQPWLAGLAMSLSLLVGENQVELLSVNRQRIAVAPDGTLSLDGIDRNIAVEPAVRSALRTLAVTAARSMPGLAGFVGIDFILAADGRAILLELNPRLTSAYVGLSGLLGRNLAAGVLHCTAPELVHA